MRYNEVGLVNVHIVEEQDVDVDRAVVIHAVFRLTFAPQLPFYALRGLQHLAWREQCLNTYTGIKKLVFRHEAPRFGLDKARVRTTLPTASPICLMACCIKAARLPVFDPNERYT